MKQVLMILMILSALAFVCENHVISARLEDGCSYVGIDYEREASCSWAENSTCGKGIWESNQVGTFIDGNSNDLVTVNTKQIVEHNTCGKIAKIFIKYIHNSIILTIFRGVPVYRLILIG